MGNSVYGVAFYGLRCVPNEDGSGDKYAPWRDEDDGFYELPQALADAFGGEPRDYYADEHNGTGYHLCEVLSGYDEGLQHSIALTATVVQSEWGSIKPLPFRPPSKEALDALLAYCEHIGVEIDPADLGWWVTSLYF